MTEGKKCLVNGALLKDRYKIEENIGQNAIGDTYMALDCSSNCKVVVKELASQKIVDTYTALQKIGLLDGIVQIKELFEEDNTYYAVLEYVEGITIEAYLEKSGGKFSLERIRSLLDPVLCSMITLSDNGISHGNISADNFVFTKDGKLKLIGFGHINGKVSDQARNYAPAELFDESVDGNEVADIYSLCAFIYRCISGVKPPEAAERKVNDTCEKPSALGVAIDASDEAALLMGMNPDCSKRLLRITALYRALYHTQANVQKRTLAEPVMQVSKEEIPAKVEEKQEIEQEIKQEVPASQPVTDDDRTEIVRPTDDDRTEIINPGYMQQNLANIVMPEADQPAMNMQPDSIQGNESGKKKKSRKKKNGNTLLIVIIVVGIIVAIVLGVITFMLASDYLSDDSDNKITEFFGKGSDDNDEGADEEPGSEVEGNSIDSMMAEGRYEDAIQAIIDAQLSEEEGAQNLQKAIDELYSQCINETSALADGGDFDTAFSIIDERIQYFKDIADKTGYVKDTHEYDLTDQRYQITLRVADYTYQKAQECANKGDENGMLEALDKATSYVSADELKAKKEKFYTDLVLIKMTEMSASGESANNIMQYIDNNLSNAGNNCRLMEFWHYYDDIYHKQLGTRRMPVTKVNVSATGYILPESSTRELNYSDFNNRSQYEIYFALYEIYARHGRIFSDTAVSDQFQKYGWYKGTISPENFDESTLSEIEKKNISLIIDYQRAMGYR